MKTLLWIFAIGLLAGYIALWFISNAVDSRYHEQQQRADSLQRASQMSADTASYWKAWADSVRHRSDSIDAQAKPQVIVIQEALEFAKSAELNLIRDSLKKP